MIVWVFFVVWLFSYSYSSGFFHYNLPSRLPPFLTAVLAAIAIPISGGWQWLRARHRRTTRLRAGLIHAAASALSLMPFVATSAVLAKAPAPFKLSADDAMGVGIDFLMLLGIALVSVSALAAMLAVRPPPGKGGAGGD